MQPHYQTRNTRKGRHSEPGQMYLLTAITKDREPFFFDWRVGALIAKQFQQADRDLAVDSLAWVVMPDHFHWLIGLKDTPLSEVVARAKSKGNHLVNKELARSGSIWQRGFHDRAIRREEDLSGCPVHSSKPCSGRYRSACRRLSPLERCLDLTRL